jgi:peptidoglycan-associated lipoprotein
MLRLTKSGPLLAAAAGIMMLGACADQSPQRASAPPAPKQTSAAAAPQQLAGPQQVGGWYQVMFDTNKFDLTPNGQAVINNVANAVSSDKAVWVTVIGKTDRVGSEAANLALSEKRAERVRDALVATGKVPANRIATRWSGEGKQDVVTPDDVAERRNRVVDITVE